LYVFFSSFLGYISSWLVQVVMGEESLPDTARQLSCIDLKVQEATDAQATFTKPQGREDDKGVGHDKHYQH